MKETRQRGILGRLFHSIFVIITSYFAVLGFVVTLCTVLVALAIYKGVLTPEKPQKKIVSGEQINEAILQITIDRPIVEESLSERKKIIAQLFSEDLPISVGELQTALRRATEDSRIKAVALDIESTAGAYTAFTALHRSLLEFQQSKKPLYVHMSEGDSEIYYLGSSADKISLAPVSGLTIPGPTFQLTYVASALNKLGIEFEVVRAGKYKSAMEFLVRDQPSPETLEMYGAIGDSLRANLVDSIASGRKKDKSMVEAWIKRSLFTSQQALAQGLVDRIGYFPEWLEELKAATQSKNVVQVDRYLEGSEQIDEPHFAPADPMGKAPGLALIEATGEIMMANARDDDGMITPEALIKELQWARDEDEVKAVVLRIDSPGGSALASDLIWNEVRKLKEKKPVVVSMGSVAASGGYYIAAPANLIVAEPTTITGSIGVIGAIPKGLKFAEKWGVSFHIISGSDRKDYFNFGAQSSEQDKQVLGESIDETYGAFVNKVAEGRKQAPTRIHEIAQGRVYTGEEALRLGLVDKLGGLKDALREAKVLAELNPEKLYPLKRYHPEPTSLLDCLLEKDEVWECMSGLEAFGGLISEGQTRAVPAPLRSLDRLQVILEDSPVLAYWPGRVTWSAQ